MPLWWVNGGERYHSALHWQVESQWAQARSKIRGLFLGRTAPVKEHELNTEENLNKVTDAAMNEYPNIQDIIFFRCA